MNSLRLALLVSLALASQLAAAASATREVRDDTGSAVRVPADNCRIVSLAPGTTAMLYAAGAGQCLVGTIAHSKEPAAAEKIPVVGDAETLDFENLLALRPTV
ncbi:MAG TPA: ABC transporter substrate-binding protein, partial [Steroidobacteraceae bacterium]